MTVSRFITLCGRQFRETDQTYFPRVAYRGRTLTLCTQACLEAFLADPEAFYKAHRNSEKQKGPIKQHELHPLE